MNDVSATALTTLKCHAIDAAAKQPILDDQTALEALEFIRTNYKVVDKDQTPKSNLVTHIALRAAYYDDIVRDFLKANTQATVINIGCGLDNRFERIDNGSVMFYDLDLVDIISIKKQIFPATRRYRQISGSVFDYTWPNELEPNSPTLLLAEGVFMYCREAEVRELFTQLTTRFTQFEFLFEVFNKRWLTGWRGRIVRQKLQQQLNFGKDAMFGFGLTESNELEAWHPDLKLLTEWSYLDSNHPALGTMRYFRKLEFMRKMQWSVYYGFRS